MKTVSTNLMTLIALVFTLSANAQNRNGGPRQPEVNTNADPNGARYSSGNNNHQGNGYYSGGFYFNYNNGGPGYYNNNYNNYYQNTYSLKKAARNNIQRSAQIIGDAVYSSNWNDIYSPWLAKAIRHQQYAKQLYYYGDYAGALNHSERASFLAINTLNYFNNGGGYGYNNGGGNYPNPYSDPNNPYYRQGTTNNQPNDGMDTYEQGNSQRKTSGNTTQPSVDMSNDIDTKLPQEKMTDRELLKVSAKDLSVE